jgi:hypothetical protein
LKDEEAMDWREKFPQLPLDKKNKVHGGVMKRKGKKSLWGVFFLCYFSWESEEKDDES